MIRNGFFGFASGLKQMLAIPDSANSAQNHIVQLQDIALFRILRFDDFPWVAGDFVIARHGRIQHAPQIFEAGAAVTSVHTDKKASVGGAYFAEFMMQHLIIKLREPDVHYTLREAIYDYQTRCNDIGIDQSCSS